MQKDKAGLRKRIIDLCLLLVCLLGWAALACYGSYVLASTTPRW